MRVYQSSGIPTWPGRLAADASALYARNLLNFLSAFHDKEAGAFKFDAEDEIVKGINLTRDGRIVHEGFQPQPTPVTLGEGNAEA